jgi:hypothetical protein
MPTHLCHGHWPVVYLFIEVRVQVTLQDTPVSPWLVVNNWQHSQAHKLSKVSQMVFTCDTAFFMPGFDPFRTHVWEKDFPLVQPSESLL